ncbi:MAG TPA: ribonuclease E/G [Rhodospirillales bacterium]|nr:ribonuclease E/G [Rhodospirillales bacterium]
MTKRMLIDATHPEETRVVIADEDRLLDFDVEIASKRQLKGNIYLAKVTRVEPSLQAAFVDYGGNRHGFLPFSEIHPDYYQIPQADREELERLERELESRAAAEGEGEENGDGTTLTHDADEETADVLEEIAKRRARILRSYRIQEVIRRRQIMLVQVVKEERGSKGAALTTYLSLAGRYCVLMPNTPRGGGISRKITNPDDRKRLKKIAQELDVPEGMGLIIRTAGQERSKAEIRRDYDYLLRLWNEIRETTLESVAPCLIYEEGNLVKRALRDLYSRDIAEVWVEGEEAYRAARRLMQIMTPSRARHVKLYKEEIPLFVRYGIEDQLDAIMSPVVELPSGGSIVIHTTEALTAIDVNSGRSTRERHIDETALKTNLEAADEIARQLRLRDLAGLIVIDFIDMGEPRHQRQVERRLREALKSDRARLQVGRISSFGLLELSRQRLRPSLQELSTKVCPVCLGQGMVRSTEGIALQALRRIQEEGIKNEAAALKLLVPVDVAIYLLNHKRETLAHLENRYGLRVEVAIDEHLAPHGLALEVLEKREEPEAEIEAEGEASAKGREKAEGAEEGTRRRRRRRRRRRGGESREEATTAEPVAAQPAEPAATGASAEAGPESAGEEAPAPAPARRRRRRRRPRKEEPAEVTAAPATAVAAETVAETKEPAVAEAESRPAVADREPEAVPSEASPTAEGTEEVVPAPAVEHAPLAPAPAAEPLPAVVVESNGPRETVGRVQPETAVAEREMAEATGGAEEAAEAGVVERESGRREEGPRRTGWWSRWLR